MVKVVAEKKIVILSILQIAKSVYTIHTYSNLFSKHNHLCQVFRKARDRYESNDAEEFTIRLIAQQGKGRQYDLPDTKKVVGLIVGNLSTTTGHRDVVLQFQSNHLQQIQDDHPLYMSMQYPLLFPYGEFGFHTEIPYAVAEARQRNKSSISIREFYAYQIQTRLLDSDSEMHDAMDKAIQWATPYQLRHLFVLLLIYCEVGNPLALWNRCWKSLGKEILHKKRKTFDFQKLHLQEPELQHYTLVEIEKIMHRYDCSLTEFKDMPQPDLYVLKELGNSLLTQELQYNEHKEQKEHQKLFSSLNAQQKQVYDAVLESVENGVGKLFFLNGPGGTGKTYLYTTIISKLRSEKKSVLHVASSGIAALLLPAGRTSHSCFKIPLNVNENSICHIRPGTMLT